MVKEYPELSYIINMFKNMYKPSTLGKEGIDIAKNPGVLKSYLELANGVLTDYSVYSVIRNAATIDENISWYKKWDRDSTIFSLAEKANIDLKFEKILNDDYNNDVMDMALKRYIWLGNMIFNYKITDAEQLQMLFYGGVGSKVYDPETGEPQYIRIKGYYDYERHYGYESDYYKEYTTQLNEVNEYMKMDYMKKTNQSDIWSEAEWKKYNEYEYMYKYGDFSNYIYNYSTQYYEIQNLLLQINNL